MPDIVNVPIILMSDLTSSELTEEADYLGATRFICKLVDRNELLEKISNLLPSNQRL